MSSSNENVSSQGREVYRRDGGFGLADGEKPDRRKEVLLEKCRVKVSSDGVYESLPIEGNSVDAKSSEKVKDEVTGNGVFEVLPRSKSNADASYDKAGDFGLSDGGVFESFPKPTSDADYKYNEKVDVTQDKTVFEVFPRSRSVALRPGEEGAGGATSLLGSSVDVGEIIKRKESDLSNALQSQRSSDDKLGSGKEEGWQYAESDPSAGLSIHNEDSVSPPSEASMTIFENLPIKETIGNGTRESLLDSVLPDDCVITTESHQSIFETANLSRTNSSCHISDFREDEGVERKTSNEVSEHSDGGVSCGDFCNGTGDGSDRERLGAETRESIVTATLNSGRLTDNKEAEASAPVAGGEERPGGIRGSNIIVKGERSVFESAPLESSRADAGYNSKVSSRLEERFVFESKPASSSNADVSYNSKVGLVVAEERSAFESCPVKTSNADVSYNSRSEPRINEKSVFESNPTAQSIADVGYNSKVELKRNERSVFESNPSSSSKADVSYNSKLEPRISEKTIFESEPTKEGSMADVSYNSKAGLEKQERFIFESIPAPNSRADVSYNSKHQPAVEERVIYEYIPLEKCKADVSYNSKLEVKGQERSIFEYVPVEGFKADVSYNSKLEANPMMGDEKTVYESNPSVESGADVGYNTGGISVFGQERSVYESTPAVGGSGADASFADHLNTNEEKQTVFVSLPRSDLVSDASYCLKSEYKQEKTVYESVPDTRGMRIDARSSETNETMSFQSKTVFESVPKRSYADATSGPV